MSIHVRTRDEHFSDPGPKRILCLDGGGVRGALSLSVLRGIETLLRKRHDAGPEFRLAHYYDLIAGTSTGAIIAAALALGMSAAEVQQMYRDLAVRIFERSLFRQGFIRAKYSAQALTDVLKEMFGVETSLGSDKLKTGLLVVMKRSDTGSPWPVSNNPRGKYYSPKSPLTVPNKDYPLWSVVRASAAAPSFFDPELIEVAHKDGVAVSGTFVDGGVSTANNPSLLALRFATLHGYGLTWATGEDELLLTSVGTGTRNPRIVPSGIAGYAALQALLGLMDDCNAEVETMLQWLGQSATGRQIDREIGTLDRDQLGGRKLLSYQRYNIELSEQGINRDLELDLNAAQIDSVQEMDAPENVDMLAQIGDALARRVLDAHFPSAFDLSRKQVTQ